MVRATAGVHHMDRRRVAATTSSTNSTVTAVKTAAERPSVATRVSRGETARVNPASRPARRLASREPSTTSRAAATPQATTDGTRRVRVDTPARPSHTFIAA